MLEIGCKSMNLNESPMKQLLKRSMPFIFGFGLLLTTVLLLMPSYAVPKAFDFYDKAQHGLVFVSLTVAGLLAYPRHAKTVCLGLFLYGGLMEVLQSTMTTTRHGDVVDWLADSVGIALGLGVYLPGVQFAKKYAINKIAA
jgi:VanZ family protein